MTDNPLVAANAQFAAYFRKNYPGPDTIIHNPDWHAPRIFRAALAAIGPGSEAWAEAVKRMVEASDALDPDDWLIRPNASDANLAKYADGMLRAALGFGE